LLGVLKLPSRHALKFLQSILILMLINKEEKDERRGRKRKSTCATLQKDAITKAAVNNNIAAKGEKEKSSTLIPSEFVIPQ